MQRCPAADCGHLNRPSARYCERCGQALRAGAWLPLRRGQTMRDGTYRILEPLDAGGMGALYVAADRGAFDRKCVLKELLDYYDPGDPEEARKAQARFETEARLLAELSHPGIPRIYSYFSEAGRHYIVMEYIEGETLEHAVSHLDALGRAVPARPLAMEEVVRHVVRICRVLEYLAAQPTPVIHHDIKPANLIVDQTSGEVRLVDFGTAQTRTPWATQTRLKRGATSVFGTEGYAAPEQFQGQSEPRSDVFALAATAYHLLTDDDPADHPFQFPRLSDLPVALGDALGRALRPEVSRRSSALEFRQALEAWLIPEDSGHPFVFRSGAAARSALELAALCEQHWPEARQHLAEGNFDRWFAERNRHDLVAKAHSARLEANADAALEAFLRRLNPRLPPPRMALEPDSLRFRENGRGTRRGRLRVRNEGRGYGQVSLTASVSWIEFDPVQAGCLAGEETAVTVRLHTAAMPLRREHQAIIAATTPRGTRISIPVEAELSLPAEVLRRAGTTLTAAGCLCARGARWGIALWTRAFSSLLRSRLGPWLLLAELVAMAAVILALWWTWRGLPRDGVGWAMALLGALPAALLAVYLVPAAAFCLIGTLRQAILETRQRSGPAPALPAAGGGAPPATESATGPNGTHRPAATGRRS